MLHRVRPRSGRFPTLPWENGDEDRNRYESKTSQSGSTHQHATRNLPGRLRPLERILERAILGQMTQPPETALAVPLQQAVSHLQNGGGLAGRLSQPAMGQTGGLQTREQLGLPDRKTYFPGVPTFDEAAALGAFPGIPANKKTARVQQKLGDEITPKKAQAQARHPELKGGN